MSIPPEEKWNLESTYGKGAKMLMKMGLTAEALKHKPLVGAEANLDRFGLGLYKHLKEKAKNADDDVSVGENENSNVSFDEIVEGIENIKLQLSPIEFKNLKRKAYDRPDYCSYTKNFRGVNPRSCSQTEAESAKTDRITVFHQEKFEFAGSVSDVNFEKDFNLPEVKYNLDLFAKSFKKPMLVNEEKPKLGNVTFAALKKLEFEINGNIIKQVVLLNQMITLKESLYALTSGVTSSDSNTERLKNLLRFFKAIKKNEIVWAHLEFYKFVQPSVTPLLRAELAASCWDPLLRPFEPEYLLSPWKKLLVDFPDQFEILMFETYFPPLEESLKEWDGASPELAIQIFKAWEPQYASSMTNYLQDELMWPKFLTIIENWDPKAKYESKRLNITPSWLKKWEKVLGSNFTNVSKLIGTRIVAELENWNPYEEKWVEKLFLKNGWMSNVSTNEQNEITGKIAAKLKNILKQMEITDKNEDTKAFDLVKSWANQFSMRVLLNLFLAAFFPNWHKFACTWIHNEQVGLEEIKEWHLFWHNAFPKYLREENTINGQFVIMLERFKYHLEPTSSIEAAGNVALQNFIASATLRFPDSSSSSDTKRKKDKDVTKGKSNSDETFKATIQKECKKMGIAFYPHGNNTLDGKQIYHCNGKLVFFGDAVLFVKTGSMWNPKSVSAVLNYKEVPYRY